MWHQHFTKPLRGGYIIHIYMKYRIITSLLLGFFFVTISSAQTGEFLDCQPSNGLFLHTNHGTTNYLLFHPKGADTADTLYAWGARDSFLDCSIEKDTAVFLSPFDFYTGFELHIFIQQNNTWPKIKTIYLPFTDYRFMGYLRPGQNYYEERYELLSYDTLLQITRIYDMSRPIPLSQLGYEYTEVSKKFKIDYTNFIIVPLE